MSSRYTIVFRAEFHDGDRCGIPVTGGRITRLVGFAALTALFATTLMRHHPRFAVFGQETRAIKALSQDEDEGLLAGKGLGFAKAAELNGYPGPVHESELAEKLQLSDAQRTATSAISAEMQQRWPRLGPSW